MAAVVFFLIGAGFFVTAAKIYLAARKWKKAVDTEPDSYRENVRLHIEEHPGESDYL